MLPNDLLLLLFLGAAAINIGLAIYGWQQRGLPGAAAFSVTMALFAILPVAQAVSLVSTDLTVKVIALKSRVEAAGIGATAWLIMIMQLTGYSHRVTRRLLLTLSIGPITIAALNWSENPLFRSGYYLQPTTLAPALQWANGPVFWIGLVYLNALMLAPLYLLWRSYRGISPWSFRQSVALGISSVLPLIVNVLSQAGVRLLPGVDLPFAAGPLMGLIVIYAVFRYRVFDVAPIARGAVIESMKDGVLVVDTRNRIVDINPAMQKMIGPRAAGALGKNAETLFAVWPELVARFGDMPEVQTELEIRDSAARYFDLRISQLSERGDQPAGRLIVVRDITSQKQDGEALRHQRDSLTLLHKITLDLLNRPNLQDLLQALVDGAARLLDAPMGELMTEQEGALVVRTFTSNQAFLRGDRARRGEAKLSWQAFDTKQPAVIEDYSTWEHRRDIYSAVPLHAVAEFPVLRGNQSIGVLAVGRLQPGYSFTQAEIETGMLFADLAALALDNAQLREDLRQESIRDQLTGLFNRRFMEEVLVKELERSKRSGLPFSVAMVDLDGLKVINDELGHEAGDEALRRFSSQVRANTRASDYACRYGGDEFLFILPSMSLKEARQRMENLRHVISAHASIAAERDPARPFTISIGVAAYPEHAETREAMLQAADKALYLAKQAGGDRVMIAPE